MRLYTRWCGAGIPFFYDDSSRARALQHPRVFEYGPRARRERGGRHAHISDPAEPCQRSHFDYAIYTSNDPESIPTSSMLLTTTGSATKFPTHTVSPAAPKKKVPVAAIAGGVGGGVVLVIALLVTVLLCRRGRRRKENASPSMVQQPLFDAPPQTVSQYSGVEADSALAAEVRALKLQVQRLEAGRADDSTALTTPSSSRSLSTLKREQTDAVWGHQYGYNDSNTLSLTDSGLRMSAGRGAEELPPTYVPERSD
ncbi:hypothetical protein C8R44DRAFT_799388 [Mycena epipterygia]|nr:hypothetical protein C8R44DRAFT_799388 [Mycena epipterygia]